MRGVMTGLVVLIVATMGPSVWAQQQEGSPSDDASASAESGGAAGEATPSAAESGEAQTEGGTNEVGASSSGTTSSSGEAGQVDADAAAFLSGQDESPLIAAPEEEHGTGWEEPEDMRFYMVGARWRLIMIPRWLLDAFIDFPSEPSGQQLPPTVTVNQSAGVEFATRRANFNIVAGVWWAGYFSQSDYEDNLGDGWFIAEQANSTDDPEFIRSRIQLLMFTIDFLYSPMFTDWFGIYVGGGLGLGVNLAKNGGLERDEATGPPGGVYSRCGGASSGDALCESDGYYRAYEEDVWPVYPWIDIILGVRFKVFRHLEINIDGGMGLGFLFGARVDYIF